MTRTPTAHHERKLVIVGAGRVGAGLARSAPAHWSVTLVDKDEARLRAALPDRSPGLVVGDASSRLVLERCGLHSAVTLVITTHDDAVNLEAARLARQEYGVQDIVVVLDGEQSLVDGLDVVTRTNAVLGQIRSRIGGLGGGVAQGGGGRGEIVQVPILAGSPVIGRRVRELHRGDWLIAMLYRGDALIVPHGDTALAEGDRVLIAGDPDDLETVALFFRGGQPTFPAAWGSRVGYLDATVEAAARWLVSKTTAMDVARLPAGVLDAPDEQLEGILDRLRTEEIGCLVMPERPLSWWARVGLTRAAWTARLCALGVPVMVVRGSASPERVLVAIGPDQDARTIGGVGIDLARQAGLPLGLLTVLPPAISTEAETVEDGTRETVRLARLHGLEPTRTVDRGNPIERIRAHAGATDLLVVGHAPARRNTVFTPDVSVFLLHSTPGPTLFVPWVRSAGV